MRLYFMSNRSYVFQNHTLKRCAKSAVCSVLLSLLMLGSAAAQQFDQAYLKWKVQQEEQDKKLASAGANYYLSRPTVHSNAGSSTAVPSSGKVRLNSASIVELQQLKGVGQKKAQTIIEYRQQHGPFKSIDEIQNVKGIGPKFLQQNRHLLTL